MQFIINRYSFKKDFVATGLLTVESEGQVTHLTFSDSVINESVSELYHPLIALLESLRKILEQKHQSLIACNGCRIDTSYRPKGGYGTYLIVDKKPATQVLNLFEPTIKIDKLCKVDEHKSAYKKWFYGLITSQTLYRQ